MDQEAVPLSCSRTASFFTCFYLKKDVACKSQAGIVHTERRWEVSGIWDFNAVIGRYGPNLFLYRELSCLPLDGLQRLRKLLPWLCIRRVWVQRQGGTRLLGRKEEIYFFLFVFLFILMQLYSSQYISCAMKTPDSCKELLYMNGKIADIGCIMPGKR